MVGRLNEVDTIQVSLPTDFDVLKSAAVREREEVVSSVALTRQQTVSGNPQDGLAMFTKSFTDLVDVEGEFQQLVAIFRVGVDDTGAEAGTAEPLGVQYCRQLINQLQTNRVRQGEVLRSDQRRQAISMVEILTAVASVQGDEVNGAETTSGSAAAESKLQQRQKLLQRQSRLVSFGAMHIAVMMCTCVDDALCEIGLRLAIALLSTFYVLLSTYYLQPTTYDLRLTAYYLLLTTCC